MIKVDNEFYRNGFFLLAAYSMLCSVVLFQKISRVNKLIREKAEVSAQVTSAKEMLSMLEIKSGMKLEAKEENKDFSAQ